MSLLFYHAPMSPATITAAVLAELELPHEAIELSIDAGDTRRPDYLKINPNGRVPAIVHDGSAIWESAAITIYLGETFGVAAGLFPAMGPQRGVAMQWIVWSNTALAEAAGRLAMALPADADGAVQAGSVDFSDSGDGDQRETARPLADINSYLGVLDGALSDTAFVLGDYSLADTQLFVIVAWLNMMQVDLRAFGNVSGWMARCMQRPVLAQMFAE